MTSAKQMTSMLKCVGRAVCDYIANSKTKYSAGLTPIAFLCYTST